MNTQLFYTLTHLHCLFVSTVKLFLDERLFAPQLARVRTSLQYREKVCGILPHTRLPEPQLARVRTLCTWRTESHRFTTHACVSHSSPGFVLFVRGEQSHTVLPHTPVWATARQGSYSLYVENRVTPFYHTRLCEPQLARVRTLSTWYAVSRRFTTHICLSHSYNLRQKHWTAASFSPIPPAQCCFAGSIKTKRKVDIIVATLNEGTRGRAFFWGCPETFGWDCSIGLYSLYVVRGVTPFYHTHACLSHS